MHPFRKRKNNGFSLHALVAYLLLAGGPSNGSAGLPQQKLNWELLSARDTFDLFMQGKLVGRQIHRCRLDSARGRVVTALEFTVSGGSSEMIVNENREFDLRGDLVRAEQELSGTGGATRWELDCSDPDECVLTVSTAGVPHSRPIQPVNDHLRTELQIKTAILDHSIEIGMIWRDTTFDLVSAFPVIVQTECIALPGPTNPGRYVFVNRDNAVRREERWEVDTLGRTVVQEIASLYTARRIGTSDSTVQSDTESGEILTEMHTVPVKSAPGGDRAILLRIADGEQLPKSVQSFYRKKSNTYILEAPGARCREHSLSRRIDSSKTGATPVMQSDDQRIRQLAMKLTDSTSSRCEKINALNGYVYDHIEKRNVATFSSALATLEKGFGDCGEHAVLLGALLRAAGIEAEIVYGLVYIRNKQAYLYHAWVLIPGEAPLFSDPALGRFPAITGYVPLVVDNTGEKLVQLGAVIDRVAIEHVQTAELNKQAAP